jgi:hypothetical protein
MAICTHGVSDNCLFSLATPKEAAHCCKRILDPITGVVPTSERMQDVNKAINALQVIFEAEGVYVPGLADGRTAGHRQTTTDARKKPRGRKRVRTEYIHSRATSHIHPDLLTALDKFDERNTSLWYSLWLSEDQENEDTESEMNN